MYQTSYFSSASNDEVIAFMKENAFATVCGIGKDGFPVATQIPLLLEIRHAKIFLQGHIMRKQNHTVAFENHQQVLVLFQGPHAYISARHYSPQNTASTWNYSTAQAKGIISFLDQHALFAHLNKLTAHFENNPMSPSLVHHMEETYMHSNMQAIEAIEIEVLELNHVFKWSQNKPVETQHAILQSLHQGSLQEQLAAEEMRMRLKKK
ncbi:MULTISPECIES: FMN-binding negative transcriptional regulator [Sediminibacterium]|uniref:FMN-binding negative transcriptional regulator n=1 Tax=Sediminibacterium TaxID=504481 RepID=UPI00047D321D|nr:FMN-binding negative transcriptional regulator [Sediminibacterium salmoneum]